MHYATDALKYKQREARAASQLDAFGFSGRYIWPAQYDEADDDYRQARRERRIIINRYIEQRRLRLSNVVTAHGRAA